VDQSMDGESYFDWLQSPMLYWGSSLKKLTELVGSEIHSTLSTISQILKDVAAIPVENGLMSDGVKTLIDHFHILNSSPNDIFDQENYHDASSICGIDVIEIVKFDMLEIVGVDTSFGFKYGVATFKIRGTDDETSEVVVAVKELDGDLLNYARQERRSDEDIIKLIKRFWREIDIHWSLRKEKNIARMIGICMSTTESPLIRPFNDAWLRASSVKMVLVWYQNFDLGRFIKPIDQIVDSSLASDRFPEDEDIQEYETNDENTIVNFEDDPKDHQPQIQFVELLDILEMMDGILDGVLAAHENNIIILYLTPFHILRDEHNAIFLSGFSQARRVPNMNNYALVETKWMNDQEFISPEVANGEGNSLSDIHSIGVIFMKLLDIPTEDATPEIIEMLKEKINEAQTSSTDTIKILKLIKAELKPFIDFANQDLQHCSWKDFSSNAKDPSHRLDSYEYTDVDQLHVFNQEPSHQPTSISDPPSIFPKPDSSHSLDQLSPMSSPSNTCGTSLNFIRTTSHQRDPSWSQTVPKRLPFRLNPSGSSLKSPSTSSPQKNTRFQSLRSQDSNESYTSSGLSSILSIDSQRSRRGSNNSSSSASTNEEEKEEK